jgi:hypothetical protein
MSAEHLKGREIYMEWLPQGEFMRVTAIDAASGVEIVTFGPKKSARHDLERLALNKLYRALLRNGVVSDGAPPSPPARGRSI